MALITTKEMGLPLCSHIYEGNINDQTEFPYHINLLKKRIPNYDPDMITLVFDGGSNNKKNLDGLETHYICSFALSSCKSLYEIDVLEYNGVEVNGKIIRAYRCIQEIWGKKRVCILTFSNDLYAGQMKELNQNLSKTINALDELNIKLSNEKSRISKKEQAIQDRIKKILSTKHMGEIIKTTMTVVDGAVKSIGYFILNNEKIAIAIKYFGKKLIITDRDDWSTEEIIKTYREQDCLEKIFKATKDKEHFSIQPQYHFTDQKIRVHIFCCLLGLTLATVLQKEVLKTGIRISKNQLLDKLSGIRRCWVKDKNSNKASNILEEMDDCQTDLWNILLSL